MINFQDWKNQDRIDFKNQSLGVIDLPDFKVTPSISFNTELHFENCNIESINAPCLFLGKRIVIKDCTINRGLGFMATYFFGGFEMTNCIVKSYSTFDSGVHNLSPNKFIIDNCTFEEYVNFFDVYFEGETFITNNKFLKGTNVGLYLQVPFGIKEGIEYKVDMNQGDINLRMLHSTDSNSNKQ